MELWIFLCKSSTDNGSEKRFFLSNSSNGWIQILRRVWRYQTAKLTCFTNKKIYWINWYGTNSFLLIDVDFFKCDFFSPNYDRCLAYGGNKSLVSRVTFSRSLFVFLSCFFWPLYCLSFDILILITPLVYLQTLYRNYKV